MILYYDELVSLCSSIIGDYCIFVEVDKTIYDDLLDFKNNSSIYYDKFVSVRYDVSICINGCSIQINVSEV